MSPEGAADGSQGWSAKRETPGKHHHIARTLKGCEMWRLSDAPSGLEHFSIVYQGFRASRSTPGYHLLPLRGKECPKVSCSHLVYVLHECANLVWFDLMTRLYSSVIE
jgi:hypothetical protein